jgi:hypothetical protein
MKISEMTPLEWMVFLFSVGAYFPLIGGVFKNRVDKSQAATTWALYTVLDVILTIVTFIKGGNFLFPLGLSVGSFVITIILIYKRKTYWCMIETLVTALVIICIIFWILGGPTTAIFFGILSQTIVGLYLIYNTIKNPVVEYNLIGYSLFLIASVLALFNAKSYGIEEIGYAIAETLLSVIIIIPLLKKWWKDNN